MIVRTPAWHSLAAALLTLAATLAIGATGARLHGIATLLPWGMLGVLLAGSAGLLAWHLARLTVTPLPRSGLAGIALPAALIPLIALPAIGAPAAFLPALMALLAARRDSTLRPLALLIGWSAVAALTGGGVPASLGFALAAGLALRSAFPHANDNPSTEQPLPFCLLPPSPRYAISRERGFAFRVVGRVE